MAGLLPIVVGPASFEIGIRQNMQGVQTPPDALEVSQNKPKNATVSFRGDFDCSSVRDTKDPVVLPDEQIRSRVSI